MLENIALTDFETSDGFKLRALYSKSKSNIVIIHVHGMTSSMASNTGSNICKISQDLKIGCLLLDTRGSGIVNSLKKKDILGNNIYQMCGTAYEIFEDCLIDIESSINYLKTLGYTKYILCGHSTGCQKSLYYALEKENDNIIGLILLAPCDDLTIYKNKLKDDFERILKLARRKYESETFGEVPEFDLLSARRFYDLLNDDSIEGNMFNYENELDHIKKIKCPILIIFGRDEEFAINHTPKEMLEKIKKYYSNPDSQTQLIGGDHGFYEHEDELQNTVRKFVKKLYNEHKNKPKK